MRLQKAFSPRGESHRAISSCNVPSEQGCSCGKAHESAALQFSAWCRCTGQCVTGPSRAPGTRDPSNSPHLTLSRNKPSSKTQRGRRSRARSVGMPSAAGETALLPHLFLGGKRPDGAAPPSPTHRLHKATAQARGSPGARRGGRRLNRAGTLGRGCDARARGHPQHRTAAASSSTRGCRIAPSLPPAPRSAAAPARLPGDRHCQVQPRPRRRPSRRLIGYGSAWLRP